jgi:hypothetical protein
MLSDPESGQIKAEQVLDSSIVKQLEDGAVFAALHKQGRPGVRTWWTISTNA